MKAFVLAAALAAASTSGAIAAQPLTDADLDTVYAGFTSYFAGYPGAVTVSNSGTTSSSSSVVLDGE